MERERDIEEEEELREQEEAPEKGWPPRPEDLRWMYEEPKEPAKATPEQQEAHKGREDKLVETEPGGPHRPASATEPLAVTGPLELTGEDKQLLADVQAEREWLREEARKDAEALKSRFAPPAPSDISSSPAELSEQIELGQPVAQEMDTLWQKSVHDILNFCTFCGLFRGTKKDPSSSSERAEAISPVSSPGILG